MSRYSNPIRPGQMSRPGRPGVFSIIQLVLSALAHFSLSYAAPVLHIDEHEDKPPDVDNPQLWLYLGTAIGLVLLGGAFAGLTIALMGQDEVYLQVIAESGEGAEKRNAIKVLKLLKRGKHWVLVTLLVGNVITNETLPIVLDRSIGGGYAAAISSTVLVIVFGEIVPQSICVRFGLPIGAWMSDFVLVLMWIFAPITWPIAKLLDRLLGEDHGTTYKKAGLKTLVTLHKTMGGAGAERLNEDEVAIISGVLDLKAKPVGSIMTPMNDVFVLSADAILDEDMMNEIMREGYSRIPIHEPKNRTNFVGMLLVKMLITYDPEDARRVSDFSLATLPETDPRTSCLDIINFFQEGKSHMVLVSDFPGEDHGALGVVTLEDVIEELIGEEIIDESDVFIDVHKAIRRLAPAPTHRPRLLSKPSVSDILASGDNAIDDDSKDSSGYVAEPPAKRISISGSDAGKASPRATTFLLRRKSSTSSPSRDLRPLAGRQYTSTEARQHLMHLGPSNAARQPKSTRINTVKVKPGVGAIPVVGTARTGSDSQSGNRVYTPPPTAAQEGIGQNLVSPSKDASGGVKAVQAGYGSMGRNGAIGSQALDDQNDDVVDDAHPGSPLSPSRRSRRRTNSQSTLGSLPSQEIPRMRKRTSTARSGSITESFKDSGGVKKLVLETTSSSEEGLDSSDSRKGSTDDYHGAIDGHDDATSEIRVAPGQIIDKNSPMNGRSGLLASPAALEPAGEPKRKKKKSKKKRNKRDEQARDENTPLLEQDEG